MKKIGVVIIIFLLAAVGWWFYQNNQQKKAEIKTAVVKRGDITKTVAASGKVGSEEEVELKFQTSGQLAWVGVKEGESVKQWQAIAQLDTRELQKTLEKNLKDYVKERNDFEEERRVTYGKLRIEEAMTDTVKRILEKNQWDLDKAVLDVELKELALKFSLLTTPISGIVTQIETPVAGVNITPAAAVFKIVNPEKMVFKANIDEADISAINASQSAKITLDAYSEEEFDGQITKISFASVSTSGGGNAFPVEIGLPDNHDLKFKYGMNGDVEIEIARKNDVLLLSSLALVNENGQFFVYKKQNGQYQKTKITIGLQNDRETEILSGLEEKDLVMIKK